MPGTAPFNIPDLLRKKHEEAFSPEGEERAKESYRQLTDQRGMSLAGEIRQFQETNPLADFALGLTPAAPALDAANMYAQKEEGAWWEQMVSAIAAAVPGGRPTRKIIASLDDLPLGGVRAFLTKALEEGRLTIEQVQDLFDEAGRIRTYHGSPNYVPEFRHDVTLENLGKNTDVWAGPGVYKEGGGLRSPIDIGGNRLGAEDPLSIHELLIPRDDIPKYAVQNFPDEPWKWDFSDQTGSVQESLSLLYPHLPPADRMAAYNISKMGTDRPNAINIEGVLGSDTDRHLQRWGELVGDRPRIGGNEIQLEDAQQANQLALAAGIRGNIHEDFGPTFASFNPENLDHGRTWTALTKEWDEGRRFMDDQGRLKYLRKPEPILANMGWEEASGAMKGRKRFATGAAKKVEHLKKYADEYWKLPKWQQDKFIQANDLDEQALRGLHYNHEAWRDLYYKKGGWEADQSYKILKDFDSGELSPEQIKAGKQAALSSVYAQNPKYAEDIAKELDIPLSYLDNMITWQEASEKLTPIYEAAKKGKLTPAEYESFKELTTGNWSPMYKAAKEGAEKFDGKSLLEISDLIHSAFGV